MYTPVGPYMKNALAILGAFVLNSEITAFASSLIDKSVFERAVFDVVVDQLMSGNPVHLPGLGRFVPEHEPAAIIDVEDRVLDDGIAPPSISISPPRDGLSFYPDDESPA